jgi:hypothetical protein
MDSIYLLPTCVGVLVAGLILVVVRRARYNLLASAIVGGVAGASAWYVTLFTIVVIMLPMG